MTLHEYSADRWRRSERALPSATTKLQFATSSFGDPAGLIGAAYMVVDDLLSHHQPIVLVQVVLGQVLFGLAAPGRRSVIGETSYGPRLSETQRCRVDRGAAGQPGRASKSLIAQQADDVLIKTAPDRLHAYSVVSLLTVAGTEEPRAPGSRPPGRPTPRPPYLEVWRSIRATGDTKTRKSRRTLALAGVEALRSQRMQQAQDRLVAGERWTETRLVFTTAAGTGMNAANVRRDFRRALALVPGVDPAEWTPRELRHSFVPLLSDAGVPLEEISRLVGHSGTSVTELVLPPPDQARDSDPCDDHGPVVQPAELGLR